MLNVFKGALLTLVREKAIFIWSLAFPLILATMFVFMFANLDDTGQFEPIPTVVVTDGNYDDAAGFADMIDTLAEAGDDQMLDVTYVGTEQEARTMLEAGSEEGGGTYSGQASEGIVGYLTIDADGMPTVHVKAGTTPESVDNVNQSILKAISDGYVRNAALIKDVAATNPAALADPAAVEKLLDAGDMTEKIDVTHNPPKESVRFYFALLGMAALFGGQIGMIAICRTQPNLSALGARRAVGALSRAKTLAATLAASWVLTFVCIVIAFLYIRFVAGVDFGGRDAACIGVIAAAALVATAFGTLLGSLPKINEGVKGGLLSGIVCFASLFAGLYGSPTMKLSDTINAAVPAAQLVNPAVQISQSFYSIMYYDTYQRTIEHVVILLVMAAVLFAASALFIRRQRYASL
ncbi:ABC transporter permease [Eggerthella sinensis]|uniref:ABC transporter permease n=1 Tax=Eggerthella sinensis TaxID=242230 RepID=UPI00248D9DFA|nr:ABC transporter permease [Eggerthella sinensis]